MKQFKLIWRYYAKDGYLITVTEYCFKNYLKKRVETLRAQSNVVSMYQTYVGHHFIDCLFRTVIYS